MPEFVRNQPDLGVNWTQLKPQLDKRWPSPAQVWPKLGLTHNAELPYGTAAIHGVGLLQQKLLGS